MEKFISNKSIKDSGPYQEDLIDMCGCYELLEQIPTNCYQTGDRLILDIQGLTPRELNDFCIDNLLTPITLNNYGDVIVEFIGNVKHMEVKQND